jgi:hypothetical protein
VVVRAVECGFASLAGHGPLSEQGNVSPTDGDLAVAESVQIARIAQPKPRSDWLQNASSERRLHHGDAGTATRMDDASAALHAYFSGGGPRCGGVAQLYNTRCLGVHDVTQMCVVAITSSLCAPAWSHKHS